jgi:hypothetical protein
MNTSDPTTTPDTDTAHINQVDYGHITDQATSIQSAPAPNPDKQIYDQMTRKFVVHTTISDSPTPNPTQNPNTLPTSQQPIQAFSSHAIQVPTFDLFGLVKKVITLIFISLPLLLILASFLVFLSANNNDITRAADYPNWTAKKIEEFVKSMLQKENSPTKNRV